MARAVLTRPVGAWLGAVLVACSGGNESSTAIRCVPSGEEGRELVEAHGADFLEAVASSPFHEVLAAGSSRIEVECSADADFLDYVAEAGDRRLHVRAQPALAYEQQELVMNGLDRDAAAALLGRTAKASFGDEGCGIDWLKGPETEADGGDSELAWRGDLCNCQARIRLRGEEVVAVVFRSAC